MLRKTSFATMFLITSLLLFHQNAGAAKYHPEVQMCDMEVACQANPYWNIVLGNVSREECAFIVKTYGDDIKRFCDDLLHGDVATESDEDEPTTDTQTLAKK